MFLPWIGEVVMDGFQVVRCFVALFPAALAVVLTRVYLRHRRREPSFDGAEPVHRQGMGFQFWIAMGGLVAFSLWIVTLDHWLMLIVALLIAVAGVSATIHKVSVLPIRGIGFPAGWFAWFVGAVQIAFAAALAYNTLMEMNR